ncbi:MAG: hypothetical protein AMXMBFR84_38900 [Candidatus Hydrogenedentota bacterium]
MIDMTHEAELLKQWQTRRDGEAFHALIQRHSRMVYGTCLRILRNSHDAEEITQDCFVLLAQAPAHIAEFIGPWLHRVATTRSLDRRKMDSRRRKRAERSGVQAGNAHSRIPLDDLVQHVDAAIAALAENERNLIVAHFLQGRTQQEIAEEQGITQQAVSHRLKRAIDALRAVLTKSGVPLPAIAVVSLLEGAVSAEVPARLSLSLAKLALAGTGHIAAPAGSALASTQSAYWMLGGLAVKKAVAGIAVATVVVAAVYMLIPEQTPIATIPKNTLPRVEMDRAAGELAAPLESPAGPKPAADLVSALRASIRPALEPGEIADPSLYARVRGSVTNHEGHPVAGAQVALVAPGIPITKPGFDNASTLSRILGNGRHISYGVTGADGWYELTGIRFDGAALVSVNARDYVVENRTEGEVTISPGAVIDNVNFTLLPGGSIEGIVFSPSRTRLADATVFCADTAFSIQTQQDGTFYLSLPPDQGKLTFYIFHGDYGRTVFGDIEVSAGQLLELQMAGTTRVLGRVSLANGQPAHGYTVEIDALSHEDGPTDEEIPPYSAVIGSEGEYSIEQVEANQQYVVTVYDPNGDPVSTPADIGIAAEGRNLVWNYVVIGRAD